MTPGARNKFGASMFKPEVFRKQIYCIEESACDIVGTFLPTPAVIWRLHSDLTLGNCTPLPPIVTPLVTCQNK